MSNVNGLYKQLAESFSTSELNTLCFDMGLAGDEVSSRYKTKLAYARDIQTYLTRRGDLQRLVDLAAFSRPNVDWSPFGGAEAQEVVEEETVELVIPPRRSQLDVIREIRSLLLELEDMVS
jgi:hypothetical protein